MELTLNEGFDLKRIARPLNLRSRGLVTKSPRLIDLSGGATAVLVTFVKLTTVEVTTAALVALVRLIIKDYPMFTF